MYSSIKHVYSATKQTFSPFRPTTQVFMFWCNRCWIFASFSPHASFVCFVFSLLFLQRSYMMQLIQHWYHLVIPACRHPICTDSTNHLSEICYLHLYSFNSLLCFGSQSGVEAAFSLPGWKWSLTMGHTGVRLCSQWEKWRSRINYRLSPKRLEYCCSLLYWWDETRNSIWMHSIQPFSDCDTSVASMRMRFPRSASDP